MSDILMYARVALAISDVQNILEPATDEIHMENRSHGLAWTKPNNGTVNRPACSYCESCGAKTTKVGINLYMELEKHKLD